MVVPMRIYAVRVKDIANQAAGEYFNWDIPEGATNGSWDSPPVVQEGQNNVYIAGIGAAPAGRAGTLKITLEVGVGNVVAERTQYVGAGGSLGMEWTQDMPDHALQCAFVLLFDDPLIGEGFVQLDRLPFSINYTPLIEPPPPPPPIYVNLVGVNYSHETVDGYQYTATILSNYNQVALGYRLPTQAPFTPHVMVSTCDPTAYGGIANVAFEIPKSMAGQILYFWAGQYDGVTHSGEVAIIVGTFDGGTNGGDNNTLVLAGVGVAALALVAIYYLFSKK